MVITERTRAQRRALRRRGLPRRASTPRWKRSARSPGASTSSWRPTPTSTPGGRSPGGSSTRPPTASPTCCSSRGIGRGDKVAILLMNCLEWLPIYFGILKTGAVAVPMNYRYTAEEIEYCLKLSEARRAGVRAGVRRAGWRRWSTGCPRLDPRFFVGADCPSFAESYARGDRRTAPTEPPAIEISEEDDGAIYFSSGTTGFPKAILHDHRSLMSARRGGAEPSRPGPRRQLPLHRSALPHRRQDALVRQPAVGQQGRAAARHQAGVDPPGHLRREGHHRLAAGALGAGHPRRPSTAATSSSDDYELGPVAAHAHRRPAGAAQPRAPLAGALPRPPVRHRLRPDRVGGPGLRASGGRERPQGGRHRHPGLPVGDQDRRRLRRAGGSRAPSASWRSRGRAS